MKQWSRKDNMQALIGFIVLSAIAALIGWSIGVFDNDIREDGWTETIYHSPSGDSRY